MPIDFDLKEVYKDILQPAAQQAGVTLGEVAKLYSCTNLLSRKNT